MAEGRDAPERHVLPLGHERVRRRIIEDPGEGPSIQLPQGVMKTLLDHVVLWMPLK